MRNHSILFFTDNEALVHVINKQSCRDKTLMVFVRTLVLVCLDNNILFKAKHIPGVKNKLADCLSRFQVQTFKQLAPANTNLFPTDIPPAFAASKLADIITHLTTSSLQPSSIPPYTRAWKIFGTEIDVQCQSFLLFLSARSTQIDVQCQSLSIVFRVLTSI